LRATRRLSEADSGAFGDVPRTDATRRFPWISQLVFSAPHGRLHDVWLIDLHLSSRGQVTAILGLFAAGAQIPCDHEVREALACGARACNTVQLHAEPGATIGVATSASHPTDLASSCAAMAVDKDYVVVADASLYYVSDLLRKLDSDIGPTASPSQLVLAAFRAFGSACVDHLEGDFAFLVWNRHTNRVCCGRDFTGRRPLFMAEWRGGLIVATSLDSIASLPGFNPQVNLTAVGADAAGLLLSLDDETCMRGVRSLRAGYAAEWSPGEVLRTDRVWNPGPVNASSLPFDDAAEHLRDLLASAVDERLSATGPTAVWMSGGRDSTAVFAAGMYAKRRDGGGSTLLPLCRSHPLGDSGREDETINEIARFWKVVPHWVHAQDTPLFSELHHRTRWSAEPFAPPFEGLTRALTKAGRALGASVALDGYGGDFLFQVSQGYLSDLVARGRVTRALRDWRALDVGNEGLRGFFHYGVQPLLPRWGIAAVTAARGGRSLRAAMEPATPPWVNTEFLREHALAERFALLGPGAQAGPSAAERETQFYLTHQFFARVNSRMAGFAHDHGVEVRSPLFDQRVVRFALSRPREERNNAGDQKRLLRAAMRGLLPDSVLEFRRVKTGTLTSYFAKHMRSDGLDRVAQLLPAAALADAGIIEPKELERAVVRYRAEGDSYPYAESLYCTLQAESWLCARSKPAVSFNRKRYLVSAG
jgi:asparagine synthase (glutamine-hydrolysing)